MNHTSEVKEQLDRFNRDFERISREVHKMIVGMEDVVDRVITCLLAGGNVLLEGVPGLGKTMLVSTLAKALHLEFRRAQFTPDLMPADIVGTNMVTDDKDGGRQMTFRPGPIFTHLLLADEINRATARTQSALLEAMEEHAVTVGGITHTLEEPFFVMATQNPVEQEGTYPLPEAQLDKFMFKLLVHNPDYEELKVILDRTTTAEAVVIEPVTTREDVLRMQALIRSVPLPDHVEDFACGVIMATRPEEENAPEMVKKYVAGGSSPRGLQALLLGAKVMALRDERYSVACEDIRKVAVPTLLHRLRLTFEGESDGIRPAELVGEILQTRSEHVHA